MKTKTQKDADTPKTGLDLKLFLGRLSDDELQYLFDKLKDSVVNKREVQASAKTLENTTADKRGND